MVNTNWGPGLVKYKLGVRATAGAGEQAQSQWPGSAKTQNKACLL